MLGGGDKGAAGAIVAAGAVAALKAAVARAYPLAHPLYKCAVHEVRVTTGVATFEGALYRGTLDCASRRRRQQGSDGVEADVPVSHRSIRQYWVTDVLQRYYTLSRRFGVRCG